jgi:hypothetical protein
MEPNLIVSSSSLCPLPSRTQWNQIPFCLRVDLHRRCSRSGGRWTCLVAWDEAPAVAAWIMLGASHSEEHYMSAPRLSARDGAPAIYSSLNRAWFRLPPDMWASWLSPFRGKNSSTSPWNYWRGSRHSPHPCRVCLVAWGNSDIYT